MMCLRLAVRAAVMREVDWACLSRLRRSIRTSWFARWVARAVGERYSVSVTGMSLMSEVEVVVGRSLSIVLVLLIEASRIRSVMVKGGVVLSRSPFRIGGPSVPVGYDGKMSGWHSRHFVIRRFKRRHEKQRKALTPATATLMGSFVAVDMFCRCKICGMSEHRREDKKDYALLH